MRMLINNISSFFINELRLNQKGFEVLKPKGHFEDASMILVPEKITINIFVMILKQITLKTLC